MDDQKVDKMQKARLPLENLDTFTYPCAVADRTV